MYIDKIQEQDTTQTSTISRVASEDISALHVVGATSEYEVETVSWNDIDMANKIIGIAVTTVSATEMVEIQIDGEVEDSFFNFSAPGRIYVGPDGLPTQDVPGSGKILQSIGVATDTDTFALEISIPLLRT